MWVLSKQLNKLVIIYKCLLYQVEQMLLKLKLT
ncbi:Uncharacterised protein [Klebsiella pneumoniae]|nr:Uncharacterised protein [Klebsiella pneumoniae]CAB5699020.1 Uncharacterised protein [Serratia marcescens]CAB5718742.1 Uncharacterised protein [Aeromonas hydrophila]